MTAPTFGVVHDFRRPLPGITDAAYYAECLDEIVLAETLGYATVWLPEHHGAIDGFLPSPLVMAAAVAARTRHIGIGTNAVVAPLHHPLRLAEDVAVADLVSGGRLTLTLVQGYVDRENELFGVPARQRPSRLEEAVAICRQVWQTGRTGFAGRRWTLPDGPFTPVPGRRVPIYVGAFSGPAFDRAARIADGLLLYGGAGVTERYARWREALADAGRTGHVPLVLGATVHVARDDATAWREAAPAIAALDHGFATHQLPAGAAVPPVPGPETVARDAVLVGSPATVADRIVDLHRQVPFDHLCLWGRLPGFSHPAAVEAVTAFATEVVPAVTARITGSAT
ncbi:LLM class flavin-dependent oxidoreductase [Actinoplanes teichomyceticus]|uniref:Alkanesulfonate monooxygenase SsuD/methylene tetrahydromethanopterin reductase-like flavin-dependent oxidoreductase (Luciferase family) n=1 Tax=Actinoplanes teichomyceticus TaxID=1867 RepID=A0A561VIL3_ACTTI|nr:LLM class flavin-dependent oxidoreductase [Actinoplanes teichomyceticus]TWG11461.1 alkanesulfonate monooxygenase SsuD/methylene tetrahydromethanopterin reductase-like flavin-dependent oxidoreductase (luciferase family) [Actinoplanes teichomyceticus]GIF15725.1 monooxygenase [Actinoplanes teichomyceticus]